MKLTDIHAGQIVRSHGVRGEVRVLPYGIDTDLFFRLAVFYVDGRALRPVSVRTHKHFILIRFEGFNSIDDAAPLIGRELMFHRSDAAVPDDGYFDEELLGLDVFDADTGTRLGELTAVDPYPAHKVYTVQGEKTYRIPAVKDVFVKSVDLEHNHMEIHVLEGMADDE